MTNTDSKYEPIENYGVIGNLQTVALVSKQASIDFMCFPDFDSPSIFASILDANKGGSFSVTPRMTDVVHRQLYLPGTAVLITRLFSDEGIAEITDFMPIDESCDTCMILRRVSSIRGKLTYDLQCSPKFDYARSVPVVRLSDENEITFSGPVDGQCLKLVGTTELAVEDDKAVSCFDLEESGIAWFMLSSSIDAKIKSGQLPDFARDTYAATISYWQDWIEQSNYKGRWRELINRSIITLKLLTSRKYGSVVAAATFSLPELVGGTRNWDYRYTWIRDGAFTMYAFLRLGFKKEAAAFLEWIRKQCIGGDLQLMYSVNGSMNLTETILDHLDGYKGSQPVRIGNGAHDQFQLDIYGELLDTLYLFNKEGGAITYDFWQEIEKQVGFVVAHWREPDHGIWEIRNEKKEFLHSRLMAWVAMDRAVKISESRSFPYPRVLWQDTRDEIFKSIYEDFWDEEVKAFVQFKGSKAVDASVLLMPMLNFISSNEPRWLQTLQTIDERLRLDVLIYRYNNALEKIDGLEGDEGTFTMCSFWYIECLAKAGQVERARENFEKMLGYANHLGLFAEELGARGEHLGNFPQAFTHLALISAAIELNKDLKPI